VTWLAVCPAAAIGEPCRWVSIVGGRVAVSRYITNDVIGERVRGGWAAPVNQSARVGGGLAGRTGAAVGLGGEAVVLASEGIQGAGVNLVELE